MPRLLRPAPPTHAVSAFGVFLLLIVFVTLCPAADDGWVATPHPHLHVERAPAPLVVDGRLDEAGWRQATRARHFAEHNPGDQTQPPVPTEAMVTYDDDYLYVAFVCYDDPAEIRATFTERDRIWTDDYVILLLDTFADQGWAYEIAVNPYGIQGDLLWSASNGEDSTYDMIYYTAAQIADEGWQAEMALPWTSLRFPDRPEQEWRVDFWRNRPREAREQYSWARYDRDEPCWPCKWGYIDGIDGVTPGSGFDVIPAFTASQVSDRQDGAEDFDDGPITGEPSLSAAYGISPTCTAELTLNPDFSQVESDAAQIDVNSAFALSYAEKRPFFQEGSDMWSSYFDVVYTRSINKPLYAAKITGRPGRSNFAALVAQDEHTPFIVPFSEGSAILRGGKSFSSLARYRLALGEQSHLGVIGTDRRHDGGGSGTTFGTDAMIRLNQNYQIELQALASYTEEPVDAELTADLDGETFDGGKHTKSFDGETFWGHGLYASLERNARHWSFDCDYWERSPSYRAENGFEPRNDQRQGSVWTGYAFYFENGLIDRLQPQINAARIWDFRGIKKDEWISPALWVRLNWAQTSINLNHMQSNELYHDRQFDHIFSSSANVDMKLSSRIDGGWEASYGHRIARGDETMGRETNLSVWLNLKPIDRLKLATTYRYVRSTALEDGRELFAGYIARSRLDLQVTRTWSLRLVLQYNDFSRSWEADPLVTWRLNPFSIFYFGSTRTYGEFDGTTDPIDGWRLTDRTYFMKLQYLWQI